jgi:hypothetical protein
MMALVTALKVAGSNGQVQEQHDGLRIYRRPMVRSFRDQ